MFSLKKYDSALKADWDQVVVNSKNGTFLHTIDYFKYHEARFEDASLIVYKKNKPVAVFPANRTGQVVYSHAGLTYAGLIYLNELHCKNVLDVFDLLIEHYRAEGAKELLYKCIPAVFSRYPAEEDLYALFRLGAKLVRRDVSSVIELAKIPKLSDSRKCVIRKAEKNDVSFVSNVDAGDFHGLLSDVLMKFGAQPVHSRAELELLMSRFPQQLKIFGAHGAGELLAATLVFDFGDTVHTQYMAASHNGRQVGALDFLLHQLISNEYKDRRFFSFGISTEDAGRHLNEGLIAQKEGFGARAIVHDFYKLEF
ncbi:GNAT family N-acetyltransferase [Pseudomonas wadenswilerensis]|uniref:GNAT family N-acetyltransferase n=1 Tax=Pseudomonas wadenswilerensis TaxID=1785161 RepID=UPI0032083E74